MTDLDQKITFHAIMVISRIRYDQDQTFLPFPDIVLETAALASTAAGLVKLISYAESWIKATTKNELKEDEESNSKMITIKNTVTRNELKNALKILEIKKNKDPEGSMIEAVKHYINFRIPEITAAAAKRAAEKPGGSTVMPYNILEFYNYDVKKIHEILEPYNMAGVWCQEVDQTDVQIQTSYYGKPMIVVYTTLPLLKLTSNSL